MPKSGDCCTIASPIFSRCYVMDLKARQAVSSKSVRSSKAWARSRTPSGAGARVQARSLRRREAIICNDTAASEPYSDRTSLTARPGQE